MPAAWVSSRSTRCRKFGLLSLPVFRDAGPLEPASLDHRSQPWPGPALTGGATAIPLSPLQLVSRFQFNFACIAAFGLALSLRLASPLCAGSSAESTPVTAFIQEYRVEGAHQLSRSVIEEAVYPFLGPGRTPDDIEHARAALEEAYRTSGYQTVAVQVPVQQVSHGVVRLVVVEAPVARLRVNGARYFSPEQIKRAAPSLAPGRIVDFTQVPRDIVALNQNPDRRVTPALKAGAVPGTVDVDLNVKDTFPIHASTEVNNRYSANTTSLRVNGSITDNNFLQRGDSANFSFQVAPERLRDAKVFSGYYLTHVGAGDVSLLVQGTKQDSNVSTLGGIAVTGRGESVGARAILRLPASERLFQSLSLGVDYKNFNQVLTIGGQDLSSPITYFPLSANYSATAVTARATTEFNAAVTAHLRGLGSSPAVFDVRRYQADGGFIYFRADLSRRQDLPHGWQLFGKVQGQIADRPLLDSEEFSGGGLATARGYLESEVVGDNALFGTFEWHTPSLLPLLTAKPGEWRIYAFADAGVLTLREPLPQQRARAYLASYGMGTRVRLDDHFNGSVDAGIPLISQSQTAAHDLRFTFRLWADF